MPDPLARRLAEQIKTQGPIPFAAFMESALFDPEEGYYSSGRVRVGDDQSDFTTAPHLTPIFSRCLARLVFRADRALGHPFPFVLFEGGPGEGRLAADLLEVLRSREPNLYRRFLYAPDERSQALAARQAAAWSRHPGKVVPADRFLAADGMYFSNELLDAFPVHRLVRQGPELREIWVDWDGSRFREFTGPLSRADLAAELAADGVEVSDGCQVEVRLGVREWFLGVTERLGRGCVVTVDYGDDAGRLYGPHRPEGTCAAYRRHRLGPDLLANPGGQDLTAHVNFSSVRRAGNAVGFRAGPLLNLRDFLLALDLPGELTALESEAGSELDALRVRRALAPLLLPEMGEAHRAMVQVRGLRLEDLGLGGPPWGMVLGGDAARRQ